MNILLYIGPMYVLYTGGPMVQSSDVHRPYRRQLADVYPIKTRETVTDLSAGQLTCGGKKFGGKNLMFCLRTLPTKHTRTLHGHGPISRSL